LKVPVVMNFLDFLTGFMETWPKWIAPPVLLKRLKRFEISLPSRYQADGVMTVSDALAECFAEAGYPIARLKPIYYGYDVDRFPLRRNAPSSDQRPIIVMHGSFDQHHLGTIAREGLTKIFEKREDVIFKFVGKRTPALNHFLSSIKRIAPGIKTECTGFIPYEEVGEHLRDAAIGIVPYEESSGTHCAFVAKAVEYLGVGLPVVSTRLKNLAQYFDGERRVRFSDFNGEDFARQTLAWLNDPNLYAVNADARNLSDRVREHLDWRTISREAVDFVEKTRHEFR
jgi:glycosyltransferase involved in cell wall biosynthesis